MKNKKKYIVMILLLFILCFNSCLGNTPPENNFSSYFGTWLWLKTEGGYALRVITPKEGTTLILYFDSFKNFRIYRNDSLKVIANYRIENSKYGDKISYYNISTFNFSFNQDIGYGTIHTDTLSIWDGVIDGYFSFYKKIGNN